MDYQNILESCEDPTIGRAVFNALKQLFDRDATLLIINVSERTIAAKLAEYLGPYLPNLDVDVEYNRMGIIPKRIMLNTDADGVYPDIIVHSRMTTNNLLAIELKKSSNPEPKELDISKLKAYRQQLGYSYALFIRLGVETSACSIWECEWV